MKHFIITFAISLLSLVGFSQNQLIFTLINDSTVLGPDTTELIVYAKLTNIGSTTISITADRLENNIPTFWLSAFCLDICYPPHINTGNITLSPGQSEFASVHFFTSTGNNTGNVLMRFRNDSNPTNEIYQRFYATTDVSLGIKEIAYSNTNKIYVNSFNAFTFIRVRENKNTVMIFDIYGRLVKSIKNLPLGDNYIDLYGAPKGILICVVTY